MFKIIVVLVSYLITFVTQAQINTNTTAMAGGSSVKAGVQNIRTNQGTVYFAIYNSQKSFNDRSAFASQEAIVKNNSVEVFFENLPQNTYAIVCFHDTNNNGKMDFDSRGMPLEDYGTSAKERSFGPPLFDDAKFEVKEKDVTFEIIF